MSGDAQQLAYADLPARHGIISGPTEDGLIISIPNRAWKRGVIPFVVLAVIGVSVHWLVALPVLLVGVVLLVFRGELSKPVVIRLTADELRFENMLTEAHEGRVDLRYPRADVYEVRYVAHSNYLLVRARGRELRELRPTRHPELLAWIAQTVHDALWPPVAKLATER